MKNADKPAFPVEADKLGTTNGISKREYFAAMAMQGILSARYEYNPVLHAPSPDDAIQDAIRYADELLKQLETK